MGKYRLRTFSFKSLPRDIKIHILSYLEPVISLFTVNKEFNTLMCLIDLKRDRNADLKRVVGDGNIDAVIKLLTNPSIIPCEELLNIAMKYNYADIFELLSTDARFAALLDCNAALIYAAYNGFADIVRILLLNPETDPCIGYNYPLRVAASNGYIKTFRVLFADDRVYKSNISEVLSMMPMRMAT